MSAPSFHAEMADVKLLSNILKSICFQEFAIVRPLEEGLKITVEDNRCFEASVYIPESVFLSYHFDKDKDICFKISLKILTECLYIYGDEGISSMKMSYKGPGSTLCLILKHSEENISVDCQIKCLGAEDFAEICLADECNVNNVVFNGEQFVETISDLDMQADEFELKIELNPPMFRLKTIGLLGDSTMDISKQSDIVALFQCKEDFSARYAFSNLKQILKVMGFANKVSISTGESGLLGIQLIINNSDRQYFVEYYVSALL